ncbi:BspA family leucine-rich repeat surface protein, partial [Actinotignum sanguinis]|uniref:BspA family leucine-rich repeat surface protein n=1 Tax=Actinotignum sanguinis TaxID=1445614 RepID=UPI00237E62E2
MKLIKRAAAVIAALAVLAGGGVAAPSLASPDTSDGGETRAMERAASVPVGPNLTATWDASTRNITVTGHGPLDREKWLEVKGWSCGVDKNAALPLLDSNGFVKSEAYANGVKRIDFIPNPGQTISFPADSSGLFEFCLGAEITWPAGSMDTSSVVDMSRMFLQTYNANPDVSNWDTSKVTNMSSVFDHVRRFHPDVSKWDTGNVTKMSSMFYYANANPDVSNWDTSKVTTMERMFAQTSNINPDVSKWDTSKVTTMRVMFHGSDANPDVSKWDTSKVTNMSGMFGRTSNANPDVSNWNTSKVEVFTGMFAETSKANPDVSKWDTGNARNMAGMFGMAMNANPDVSNWNTANVTTTDHMFYSAKNANPDISKWKIPNLRNTAGMFQEANSAAFLDISGWGNTSGLEQGKFIFATEGRAILRLTGVQYKALMKAQKSLIFKSGIEYNIYDDTAPDVNLSQRHADGAQAFRLLRGVTIQDDHTYLIRPASRQQITVTAENQSIYSGDAVPTLTYKVAPQEFAAMLEGDVSTSYTTNSVAGSYPITQGTLRLKQQYSAGFTLKFVPGTVTAKVKPPQPPAQVTYSNWDDGAKDCNSRKVSQSRIKTTTPYKWDSGKRQWVLDTSKAVKTTENRQRDMKDGEHKACTPQPPAQVTYSSWDDGAKDCNSRKVSQSRIKTTTPYKWDSGK